jgi:hypothetical protein
MSDTRVAPPGEELTAGRAPARLLPAVLLSASVAIAVNLEIAIHELGHVTANAIAGVGSRIELHPFGPSRTVLDGILPDQALTGSAAAGPAAAVAIGLLVTLAAWRVRRPRLLPLLLVGPLALVMEGANGLIQLVEGAPGTDWSIVAADLPIGLLVPVAIAALLLGLVALVRLLPVAGLDWRTSVPARVGLTLLGFATYFLVGFAWIWLLGPGEPGRNAGLLVFAVLTALVIALAYPVAGRRAALRPATVGRGDAAWVSAMAGVLVIGLLLVSAA